MGGWRQDEHHVGPAFEDELANSIAMRRLHGEWVLGAQKRTFRPPFDVYETEQHIVIKVEIAGMQEEDFDISLDGHLLTISGIRRDTPGKLAYQRMEVNYGEFRLDIRLPHVVKEEQVEASYDRGFLLVSVPRQPQQRRIPISSVDE